MALVTRYFSTAAAGAGDGTSWADRAALFSGGNWSSVITGFNFRGADALEARVGPGTYACGQSLASGLFANAPTVANPLILHGCDSSGNRLSPPDPDWTSDMPAWDHSSLPIIATTSNVNTVNLPTVHTRLLVLSATGTTDVSVVQGAATVDWCVIKSTSTASIVGSLVDRKVTNSVIEANGTSFDTALTLGANELVENVRVAGNSAASSGNRLGIVVSAGTSITLSRITVFGFQAGITNASSAKNQTVVLSRSVIAHNAGVGYEGRDTAGQIRHFVVSNSVIVGNGAYGIDAKQSLVIAENNRLRDNASGNFTGFGNYPTDLDNYTTDSDDATEFNDSANGDYRIKAGLPWSDRGIGVSQMAAPGGTGARNPFRPSRIRGGLT